MGGRGSDVPLNCQASSCAIVGKAAIWYLLVWMKQEVQLRFPLQVQRGAGVSAVLEDLSWREYRLCAVGAAWQERMGALQRSLASVGVDGGLVCIDRQE